MTYMFDFENGGEASTSSNQKKNKIKKNELEKYQWWIKLFFLRVFTIN